MSVLTIILLLSLVAFPALMLCFSYPVSHKLSLFWSNYITKFCARVFFAILKCYRGFNFISDEEGKKNLPDQFLVISNHQSLMDIIVYFRYFDGVKPRFVAKDALGKAPMVGKMLRTQGHCMIPRKGGASIAMRAIEQFGKRVMERGQYPIIFPEGTRSKTGELGQFYSAGFRRLEETVKLPVVVCALDGGWKLSDLSKLLTNLKKGAYRVKILKVFDAPQSKEDEKRILEVSRQLIQEQLDSWRKLPADSISL